MAGEHAALGRYAKVPSSHPHDKAGGFPRWISRIALCSCEWDMSRPRSIAAFEIAPAGDHLLEARLEVGLRLASCQVGERRSTGENPRCRILRFGETVQIFAD